jgi:hypothetical protein
MPLTNAQKLFRIRLVHTLIYVINGTACFVMLYAGVTGETGTWLWIAVALVAIETVILFANGIKCPLAPLAEKYGARETDFLYDTFIPERLTRYTFHFFSVVVLAGLAFAGLRWLGAIV